ncbi:MAG TPA: DUF4175 family protein [Blastocatellia bacterium]|nr:DUF4175 family protein [Blastocatellia bacterium]
MSPQLENVSEVIKQVRRRIQARNLLRGAAITVAVAALSLLITALTAGLLKQRHAALIVLRVMPFVLTGVAAWLFLVRAARAKIQDATIARLIEEKCELEDRVVTAVEYSENPREASPAILDRLVEDASRRASSVHPNTIVDPRRSYAYGAAAAVMLLALIGAWLFGPKPVSKGLAALYSSSDDSVAANSMFINVSPGTARVPRGSDQKIKATLAGFDASIAQVFMRKVGADNWVAQTMEPAKNAGEFQFLIFNIQDSVTYYVEAKDIRSPEFALEVADLPFVKQIDLVLNFPAYTHLPSKKIENGGEVAALKGTVVQVTAQLSANVKAARIVISDGAKVEMTPVDDSHFTGQFTVKQNGTYRIELTSEGGERYNGSNEYDITVLEDHAPTVVIDKPGRDMKVSSIQEVFTQVRAEDDYGVSSIELYYSVNGGEEKKVQLQDLKSDAAHTLSGAHTFFLEEFGLQPGDFISYYAKARDNSASPQEATSDIYFMEVRPFDREFRQAQQQGQGGGSDQESNALTRRQREIIAATFRVQREIQNYTTQEKDENVGAVTLSQEKLKTDTENLAERIRRRLGDQLNSQTDFAKLVEYLAQAAKEMAGATDELRGKRVKEALSPEQRALQQLLRAEAIFRDIQVARGNGQGQGQQQEQQELADLFELQLDKMKNQYETVQSQQQQNQNQQQDEIARRLAELARRQQQQVEQRMRSQGQQQQGGGGGSQRQQQEMIDEAQKMARELERLSRDRRDPKLADAAQQMQQAADELRRAQASQSQSNSSSQGGTQATADQLRALQRMEQARRLLESAQHAGGQQGVQGLRQRAEDALKRQEEISRSVDDLARKSQSGGASEDKKQQIADRKQALADQVAGLERDLDQAARGMGQDRQQASDKLREAAGAIRQNRIPDRIRQNQELIANGWYDQARERERIIKGNLEEVLKDVQAADGSGSKRAQGESLEDALNRARELADNLESLRRRIESGEQEQNQNGEQQGQQGQQANQSGQQQAQSGSQSQSQGRRGQQRGQQAQGQQNQQGQQSGAQSGQQNQQGQQSGSQAGQQARGQRSGQRGQNQQARGQQNQSGQQSGQQPGQQGQQAGQEQGQQGQQQGRGQQQGQQANQSGGRPTDSGAFDPASMGGGPPRSAQRQLESELRQRLADAEELKRALGRNSDLAHELNRAMDQLRHINPNAFADPSQLALLKNDVIDPVRQIEIELARRLQAKLGNNGAGAFGDGDAPDRYRKMIEDYYRRLSARQPAQRP